MQFFHAGAKKVGTALGLKPLWHRYLEWRAAQRADEIPLTDERGVSLPPALLMTSVVAHADWRRFVETGASALASFAGAIDRNGGDFGGARRILDFGCGCGRLARHLPVMTGAEIFGVDCNGALSGWCARHLKGTFGRNKAQPPLAFHDACFDALYALSVFTHQRLATQNAWLAEFSRILAPGGFALVTFHDEDHPSVPHAGLSRDAVLSRGFIVHNDAAEGSNFMATFQSREFFRAQAAPFFEVAELVPGDKSGVEQTLAVLRKRQESATGNRQPATG